MLLTLFLRFWIEQLDSHCRRLYLWFLFAIKRILCMQINSHKISYRKWKRKQKKKQPKQSFFFSSTLRPSFPSFIYTFVCLFFFRFNTIPYWQLIQRRFWLAIKWMEVWIRSSMPHYNALVPSLVWCWIYLNETEDKQSKYWFAQFVNQSPFNESNGKQQLFIFVEKEKKNKKQSSNPLRSIYISIRLRSFKIASTYSNFVRTIAAIVAVFPSLLLFGAVFR